MSNEEKKEAPARVLHGFHHENATPAAEFIKTEKDTVTMLFPKRVVLLLDNHQKIEFPAGPNEVPMSLVEPKLHFYLAHNGVKPYMAPAPVLQGEAKSNVAEPPEDEPDAEEGETEVEAAESPESEETPMVEEQVTTQRRRPVADPPRRRKTS